MTTEMTTEMTPEQFARDLDLAAPVMARLEAFDRAFMEAAAIHSLVSRSTLPGRWARHYLDSAQLYRHLPVAQAGAGLRLMDLGSGAGFPGLVLAAMGFEAGLEVVLVESTAKKAAFLRDVAAAVGLSNVEVLATRIEAVNPASLKGGRPQVITARAVAPLERLCGLVMPLVGPETLCLFSKGARAGEELTRAREHWHMSVTKHPSITSDEAVILAIEDLGPRQKMHSLKADH